MDLSFGTYNSPNLTTRGQFECGKLDAMGIQASLVLGYSSKTLRCGLHFHV